MTVLPANTPVAAGYVQRLTSLVWEGLVQVIRPASHSRRADAARAWARRTLILSTVTALLIVALMVWLDETEITWMPPRGTPSLWPLRIVTDFGKSTYVILVLLVVMIALLLLAPRVVGVTHATLIGLAARVQYVFLAVLLSDLVGEVLKGMIGRGRPFVGGQANAFNFSHFSWSEAYASFPSGHATTSCALAFAVAAVWPRLRMAMLLYAVVILVSRLVLLAHHPSDVVSGALLGVIGAMVVRYWFAARSVVFLIRADGTILPRRGASASDVACALRKSVSP